MSAQTDKKICLFGAGGHGRVVATQMLRAGFKELCFGDENIKIDTLIADIPVLYANLGAITDHVILITVGNSRVRQIFQEKADQLNLRTMFFIAEPSAYSSRNLPGAGSMILHGAVVNDNARIGAGVIINSSAVIEHDVEIGNFSHISPGAVLAGGCKIGANCWVGANATIIQGVNVAARVTVGAGSVVIKDIVESGVYVGAPVRKVK